MSTKKLTKWCISRYKSTDSLPKDLRYDGWVAGLKDPVVGVGDKKYSRALYKELAENQIPITDIFVAETRICKKIQQTKRFCTEHFPNLNKSEQRYAKEWWLWSWVYNDWGTITKVSDLFIKGLGSFDFAKVAKAIDHPWSLRKSHFLSNGYFPRLESSHGYFSLSEFFNNKESLKYLVKYWAVLKNHEHVDAVVENLRERKQLAMPFMDVHPDKLGVENGNVVFGWLADVSIPGFTIPKTGKELMDAAVKFRNCARNYVAGIMRKRSIILWNDVGMAEYRRDHGLGQCSGVGNCQTDRTPFQAIEEEVMKLFKK